MTQNEFDNKQWGCVMEAKYKGEIYSVGSVNFEEKLIGLDIGNSYYFWVRCENITIVS